MEKNYFVTGASGFLGRWVVTKLAAGGNTVNAFLLPGDPFAALLPHTVTVTFGDITDKGALSAWFGSADGDTCVIHCAGMVSILSRPGEELQRVNVGGTRNVIACCMEKQVKKFVYVSSVHAIPELPKGIPQAETGDFSAALVNGAYAKSKAEATRLVLNAASDGLRAAIVHPSGIIGPGDYGNGNITQMIRCYCEGTMPAGVQGGYDFVDVRDVANGILSACENGKNGECYILSGHYETIRQMMSAIGALTGKIRNLPNIPLFLARMVAPMFERHSIRRHEKPFFTPCSVAVLGSNGLFLNTKAKKELGFSPRPFEETIRDTLQWIQKQHPGKAVLQGV